MTPTVLAPQIVSSPNEEERYGVSKIDAAIGFLDAKLGRPFEGRLPVALDRLRIPIERDGRKKTVGLEDATVEEIYAAARQLRRANGKPHPSASPVVVAITRALAKGALKKVSVRFQRGQVSLGSIPVEALRELGAALAKVKLPPPA